MKKQMILRGVLGALGGVFVGQVVIIVISLCMGQLMPVPPALEEQLGSQLTAYILQMLGLMLYGGVWAAATVVWDTEWPLLKQTAVHALCYSLSALPIAWMLHWFEHSLTGFLWYFFSFAAMYLPILGAQYMSMKKRVQAMNEKLKQQ